MSLPEFLGVLVAGVTLGGSAVAIGRWLRQRAAGLPSAQARNEEAEAAERVVNSALAILERAEHDIDECRKQLSESEGCRDKLVAERDALRVEIAELRRLVQ